MQPVCGPIPRLLKRKGGLMPNTPSSEHVGKAVKNSVYYFIYCFPTIYYFEVRITKLSVRNITY